MANRMNPEITMLKVREVAIMMSGWLKSSPFSKSIM
jgi:hypothetical protein